MIIQDELYFPDVDGGINAPLDVFADCGVGVEVTSLAPEEAEQPADHVRQSYAAYTVQEVYRNGHLVAAIS